tara:strand:- start:43 stop:180 length:138 start_codon:yes stop_codon:yes gene_type:complete
MCGYIAAQRISPVSGFIDVVTYQQYQKFFAPHPNKHIIAAQLTAQ